MDSLEIISTWHSDSPHVAPPGEEAKNHCLPYVSSESEVKLNSPDSCYFQNFHEDDFKTDTSACHTSIDEFDEPIGIAI